MDTSTMTLNGKVAIVTGASSGIGRAIALLFASEGARVVVTARRQELLDGLVQEIETAGGSACALPGDVTDEGFALALVEQAKSRFGGLDIAVNNAGVLGPMGATPEVTREAWDATMATNLTSAFLGAKYQIPAMLARGKGSLIFVSSFVGYTVAMPGAATYAASKAGQIGLMKALRRIRTARHSRQRTAAGRNADGGGRRDGRYRGDEGLRAQHARLEAHRSPRGAGTRGIVPGIRRSDLHHRKCDAGGWRSVDQQDLSRRYFSSISSQPSALTVTRSPASTTTVVVSASMIAGPARLWPGLRSSSI